MKIYFNDLELEGQQYHELVLEHHDGTTSFILTDDELRDLYAAVEDRYQGPNRPRREPGSPERN